ncbi:MAG: hypothetical protein Q9M97_08785 [Candidatus Gracilibacteria bacterium]|nr:hypothetical protein [Candidatus Gracilibacteria bacterium]
MEHLSKKDIYYWLEEKENIDRKIVKKIWDNLGGSVWEIWQVLVSYKNTGDYKFKLDDLLQVKYSLVAEWYNLLEEGLSNLDLDEKEKNKIKQKIEIFLKYYRKNSKKMRIYKMKRWISTFGINQRISR